jgi:hypothetical protein
VIGLATIPAFFKHRNTVVLLGLLFVLAIGFLIVRLIAGAPSPGDYLTFRLNDSIGAVDRKLEYLNKEQEISEIVKTETERTFFTEMLDQGVKCKLLFSNNRLNAIEVWFLPEYVNRTKVVPKREAKAVSKVRGWLHIRKPTVTVRYAEDIIPMFVAENLKPALIDFYGAPALEIGFATARPAANAVSLWVLKKKLVSIQIVGSGSVLVIKKFEYARSRADQQNPPATVPYFKTIFGR